MLRRRALISLYPHHEPWVTNVTLFTCTDIKAKHRMQVAENEGLPLAVVLRLRLIYPIPTLPTLLRITFREKKYYFRE